MRLPLRFPAWALVATASCAPAAPPPPPPAVPAPTAVTPPPSAPEATPLGRLPEGVRPTRYDLALRVDPGKPRFSGTADIAIDLDRPRDTIWLHGKDLAVSRATLAIASTPAIDARWEQVSKSGVAKVSLASPIGPGRVTLHVEYDAPFAGNDEGLYTVARGADHYAFTQFEATDARRAFPCFDEPGFKTPFAISVSVPRGMAALSNTHEVSRATETGGAWDRVTFAPTEKLPSYLVALAVGPLDVVPAPDLPPSEVRKRPLPLRAVATRGRGRELGYALAHAGELVTALEQWFGTEYPYDKLDLFAVPDKSGAMENAGAIMFGEGILLIDEPTSTPESRFTFASVVGHEVSHQWFGDLVTMRWWDDLWLNEAFATWMEPHVVGAVRPDLHPEVHVFEGVYGAMNADSLISARKVRQEIADDNDIESAFDSITYDKGSAVLRMFERWIGPKAFQTGIRSYLAAHRFGTAGAGDLFTALSTAAGKDVAPPLRTFLDHPGLPLVDARPDCQGRPRLVLRQSRFLPLGSSGQRDGHTWQIPVCVRYGDDKATHDGCIMLTSTEDELPLDVCPTWVMPNVAYGYYRWSLPSADRNKLAAHLSALNELERMSFADSLHAAFLRGEPFAEVMQAMVPLAADPSYAVVAAPMDLLATAGRWLDEDPLHTKVEARAGTLFDPVQRSLGWSPKKGEDGKRSALRQAVIELLAFTARSPAVRREAAARGRARLGLGHAEPLVPELAATALQVAAEEGGAPVFEALLAALPRETSELERRRLLAALGSVKDPALAARARALELDPRVRSNEVSRILGAQIRRPETRDGAWRFLAEHLDELIAKTPSANVSGLVGSGVPFCDRAHKDETERLFAPRVATIEGGPRTLSGVLEEMSLCIARRAAHEPGMRAFFSSKNVKERR